MPVRRQNGGISNGKERDRLVQYRIRLHQNWLQICIQLQRWFLGWGNSYNWWYDHLKRVCMCIPVCTDLLRGLKGIHNGGRPHRNLPPGLKRWAYDELRSKTWDAAVPEGALHWRDHKGCRSKCRLCSAVWFRRNSLYPSVHVRYKPGNRCKTGIRVPVPCFLYTGRPVLQGRR